MQLVGIQYLRGAAALSVVLFHIGVFVLGAHQEKTLLVGGLSAGVDIFFVISGFIIWKTTERGEIAPMPWWRGRLIRIVPLYWLALLMTLATKKAMGAHMPNAVEAFKDFAFIPATNSADGTMTPFLSPGWTLNYEFAFYGMMAVALNLSSKWKRGGLLTAVFVGLVALRSVADTSNPIQFRMTSPLFFEFLAGIGIAVGWGSVDNGGKHPAWGVLAALGAAAFYAFVTPRIFPDGPRFVYFGVPATLIVLAAVWLEPAISKRIIKSLKSLGDSSYSLYLSHPLVLMVGFAVLGNVQLSRAAIGLVLLVSCVGVGLLMHRYLERPLVEALNQRFNSRHALRAPK